MTDSTTPKLTADARRLLLWVALCFGLTSGVYLSWLDHLVAVMGAASADWYSMVIGYLFQSAGAAAVAWWLRKSPDGRPQAAFLTVLAQIAVVAVPTLTTASAPGVILFGWGMNLLCGAIAGFYLYEIAVRTNEHRFSFVFGGGYALSTAAVGLLAAVHGGSLIHSPWSLCVYIVLAAGIAWFTLRNSLLLWPAARGTEKPPSSASLDIRQLLTVCGIVALISLVKNLGYSFPSADIEAGLIPALSRVPYAIGLVAAGIINDRNRQHGLLCTLFAMMIPFLMLGLIHEPISSTVFWGLDYLFFAFFSVFRTVIFLDLAKKTGRWELAPLGLLMGRLGDAAGTAVNLLCTGHAILLISVTAVLFVLSGLLLFRLYERMYAPKTVKIRQEQELFAAFCKQHDLSAREQDILRLIQANKTNREIAEALFISENTVKYHVRNLLQKTGCQNRGDVLQKFDQSMNPGEDRQRLRVV